MESVAAEALKIFNSNNKMMHILGVMTSVQIIM
jgi:hypothetical protein